MRRRMVSMGICGTRTPSTRAFYMFQAKKGWQTQKWGETSSWHAHFHTSLTSVVHRTTSESKISVGQSSQWQLVWIAQSSRRILHGQKQRKPGKSSPNSIMHIATAHFLQVCADRKEMMFSTDILCVEWELFSPVQAGHTERSAPWARWGAALLHATVRAPPAPMPAGHRT